MKNYLLLLFAFALFAVGCQTPSDDTKIEAGETSVLNVSLEQTRVSLGAKGENGIYPVYWSEGDKIVVNGVVSDEAQIDAANRTTAQFAFSATPLSYPYHVIYPYCASTTAENAIVEFPAEQSYAEGTFSANSAPMCGYVASSGDRVVLNHLASILHFSIKASTAGVVLDKVVVVSTTGAKLSGEFAVDCKTVTITATEGCKNVVRYSLPENFALSTTTPSDLFIALPAVDVGTCRVEFITTSGAKMEAKWTPKEPLSKGVVREFAPITYREGVVGELQGFDSYEDTIEVPAKYKKYADADELKIMSFNVRTKTTETDPANNWDNRKAACIALIKDQQPNIIGFQEAKYSTQWVYLKEQLAADYEGYGVNRDTGKESGTGETMGILYNKNVIEKIDGGTFWLSETPDVPSKGFGANYSRNATWGIFKHKPSGVTFYYINTHLDHQVANAQIEGMKLIAQDFEAKKDTYPLFLTGDLNIKSNNVALDAIEGFMYNAREVAPTNLTDYDTTYNGYVTTKNSIIDHVYCSNYLKVVEYHTINDDYGVPFVSDHYPIYAIIKLK